MMKSNLYYKTNFKTKGKKKKSLPKKANQLVKQELSEIKKATHLAKIVEIKIIDSDLVEVLVEFLSKTTSDVSYYSIPRHHTLPYLASLIESNPDRFKNCEIRVRWYDSEQTGNTFLRIVQFTDPVITNIPTVNPRLNTKVLYE